MRPASSNVSEMRLDAAQPGREGWGGHQEGGDGRGVCERGGSTQQWSGEERPGQGGGAGGG